MSTLELIRNPFRGIFHPTPPRYLGSDTYFKHSIFLPWQAIWIRQEDCVLKVPKCCETSHSLLNPDKMRGWIKLFVLLFSIYMKDPEFIVLLCRLHVNEFYAMRFLKLGSLWIM